MELVPGVYTYEIEWTYDEPLGVHVIETDHATILFGAGTEDTADEISDIATTHNIDAVIVEHGDPDHYGGVPILRDTIVDLDVAVPANDATVLEEANITPDLQIEADNSYWGIQAISTPGHTRGNMSYIYDNVLVAGDTIVGSDSSFAADDGWSGPFAVMTSSFNADDDQTRESVSVVREYDFEIVLISHGTNVTENAQDAVNTVITDLERG
jgi:glyoxylase-like metal-dependent hydrolase (beta-lactamase superfamily II)